MYKCTQFLEKASIRSVIIHEYVKFSGVGTCLAFVVEGAPELAVCFAVRSNCHSCQCCIICT